MMQLVLKKEALLTKRAATSDFDLYGSKRWESTLFVTFREISTIVSNWPWRDDPPSRLQESMASSLRDQDYLQQESSKL